MSYYTVVKFKKTAKGLVKHFRTLGFKSYFEEIPQFCRVDSNRRYMVFVLNPGRKDTEFAEMCENLVNEFNQ